MKGLVLRQPQRAAALLGKAEYVDGARADLMSDTDQALVFEVRFDPPPPAHLPDYPSETVRITVRRHDGRCFAVPVGRPHRRWHHRNEMLPLGLLRAALAAHRPIPWEWLLGSLCLEYDRDPAHLRWSWGHGLDAFVRIVQRHLWFEEYWRRTGEWPVEDTPHVARLDGRPHPIRTPELRAS